MYSEFAMVSLLVVIGRQVISSCDVVAISDAVNDIYIPVISTHITVKVYSDLKYCICRWLSKKGCISRFMFMTIWYKIVFCLLQRTTYTYGHMLEVG